MKLEDAILSARGWSFHYEIATQALEQYRLNHYDDAVLAAFKVVEERLRAITALPGATAQKLVDAAFHPVTGLLIDPHALPPILEGRYLFYKGAFLCYRNPQAHSFVGVSQAEAFDLLILANRLLLTIENADQYRLTRQRQGSTTPEIDLRRNTFAEAGPYSLDTDNDSKPEIVLIEHGSEAPFTVFDVVDSRSLRVETEPFGLHGYVEDLALGDVDNDGLHEIICVLGWTANTGLVFYKFRNGRYELLRAEPGYPDPLGCIFPDAHVADYDGDGRLEIISVPWEAVPEDLIPPDHDRKWTWGRVRNVWRWNRGLDRFELVERELIGFGGR